MRVDGAASLQLIKKERTIPDAAYCCKVIQVQRFLFVKYKLKVVTSARTGEKKMNRARVEMTSSIETLENA